MMEHLQKNKVELFSIFTVLYSLLMMNQKAFSSCGLANILHDIYKVEVSLEHDHVSKKNVLMFLLDAFEKYCGQKCPVFAKYFQQFYLTGSYFEGLRVKEATEFDINVVFNFPYSDLGYKVNELNELPSFATFHCRSSVEFKNIPFLDERGYITKELLLNWFQSLVDSFLNSNDLHYPGVMIIKSSNSGPARTLKVLYKSVWISIDLVPVFTLKMNLLKKHDVRLKCSQKSKKTSICYVVPKPLKAELACLVPQHISPEQVWRTHFPEAEKLLLEKRKHLKYVIKLVKALRDKEEWPLSSYVLKVAALWLLKRHPDEKFWSSQSVDTLFFLFLEFLEERLAAQSLSHLFYPSFNLFHNLHKTLLRDLKLRISKIIRQLKSDPEYAFILFKVMCIPHFFPKPSLLHN